MNSAAALDGTQSGFWVAKFSKDSSTLPHAFRRFRTSCPSFPVNILLHINGSYPTCGALLKAN